MKFCYNDTKLCNNLRIVVVDDDVLACFDNEKVKGVFVLVVFLKNDDELPIENESYNII